MMNYWGNMMGWSAGAGAFGVFGFLFQVGILVLLVLAIVWLWQQITKK